MLVNGQNQVDVFLTGSADSWRNAEDPWPAARSTQTVELTAAQQAVDRFDVDSNSFFPTLASLSGTTGAWQAGKLPEAAPIGGDGSSVSQAKVFTQEGIAGFDFGATFDTGSIVRLFIGD